MSSVHRKLRLVFQKVTDWSIAKLNSHFMSFGESAEGALRDYSPRIETINCCMDDNFDKLSQYETGIWVFLILATVVFFGLIFWMAYSIFL